jgi:methionine-rich copper-binding protein CopC
MRRLLVAIAAAMLFAVLAAPAAFAAPSVLESDPPDGAEEHKAPDSVTITFDMPLDDTSLIKVVDECGRQIDAKNTTVTLNEMTVDIAKKPSGHYKAFYYANPPAGATGSSSGTIEFHVHMGPSCGDEASAHEHGGEHAGHGGNEHEGHDGGPSHDGHDGTDHSAHTTGGGSHTDHTSTTHSTHTEHAAGTSHQGHNATAHGDRHHKHHAGSNGSNNTRAGPAPTAAPLEPVGLNDGQAVLVSIGSCLLLGLAGGWLIRTNQTPRRKSA